MEICQERQNVKKQSKTPTRAKNDVYFGVFITLSIQHAFSSIGCQLTIRLKSNITCNGKIQIILIRNYTVKIKKYSNQ
jgi:hypothetical protein